MASMSETAEPSPPNSPQPEATKPKRREHLKRLIALCVSTALLTSCYKSVPTNYKSAPKDAAEIERFTAKVERGVLGEKAPSLGVKTWFNLPEGKDSVDVGDYKGKVVYLYGFQSWCPGCHKLGFPTLTKLIEHYKNNDEVAFVAVQTVFEGFSFNTPQKAKETAARYHLTIPIGHSGSTKEPSTMMQRYRTRGTPWTVIIDREGIIRYNHFHITPNDAIALIDRLLEKN